MQLLPRQKEYVDQKHFKDFHGQGLAKRLEAQGGRTRAEVRMSLETGGDLIWCIQIRDLAGFEPKIPRKLGGVRVRNRWTETCPLLAGARVTPASYSFRD